MDFDIMPATDIYKEYLRQLRLLEFEHVYPVFTYNTTPILFKYVTQVYEEPCTETTYHTLFNNLKTIIKSYICYHNEYMDEITRKCQDYTETCPKEEFVDLVRNTKELHKTKQSDFAEHYLPTKSEYEKSCFEKVESEYVPYNEKYEHILKGMETLNEESEDRAVIAGCFKATIEGEAALLKFTHKYISLVLGRRVRDIDISVNEICQRLSNNLKELQRHSSGTIKVLLNALYNQNKEWIEMHRSIYGASALKNAEIIRTITNIRQKIKDCDNKVVVRVEEELHFWTKKAKNISKVSSLLGMLHTEFASVDEQAKYLVKQGVTEADEDYLKTLGKLKTRKTYLNRRIEDVSKVIFSLFDIKGMNEVWFNDESGRLFCIDEYGHQVFRYDHGKRFLHLDCEGNYREVDTSAKYYYDDVGRYIRDEFGEKSYQLSPCTSLYKLNELKGTLYKTTEDCGHSKAKMPYCRQDLKNMHVKEPEREPPADIKGTLDVDTVKYLMTHFEVILPRVLHDVGVAMPQHPMHFIAHSLIKYKYRRPYAAKLERLSKKMHKHSSSTNLPKPNLSRRSPHSDIRYSEELENQLIIHTQALNDNFYCVQQDLE